MRKWTNIRPAILGAIASFGIPLAIYLAFPNRNHSHDALTFIIRIGTGDLISQFHPHHLLYTVLGFVLREGLEGLGISISSITLMQTVNSVVAATGVLFFFIILLRLSKKVITALIFALLFAFSLGLWHYAVDAEVYVCGLVFLISSLLLIVVSLSQGTKPKPGMLIGLGVLGGMACLFHQMHILFVAVGCTFIYIVGKGALPRLKMAAFYLVPLSILVGGSYIAVGYMLNKLPNLVSFYHWLTMFFHIGKWGHFDGLRNFMSAAVGLRDTFFGKPITITSTEINDMGLYAIFILGLILLLCLILIATVRARAIYKSKPWLVILSLVWIVVYGGFIFWWQPGHKEFWLHILPPIWLLLFLGFETWQFRWPNWKLALPLTLLCILLFVNLICFIIPNSDIENSDAYQLVKKLHGHGTTSNDLVLTPYIGNISGYNRLYFGSPLRVISLSAYKKTIDKQSIFEDLRNEIESTLDGGFRVLISGRELNPKPGVISSILGESRGVKTSDQAEFYAPYRDKLVKLFSYEHGEDKEWMFEITPIR